MKILNILMLSLILMTLNSCYKDKGNYDYKDVNEMEVTILPAANSYDSEYYTYEYVYRQPATDTLSVTYSPEVTQSLLKDDSNIEYEWLVRRNGRTQLDTIRTKNLILKYPPKASTNYEIIFRATDLSNQLSLYRVLRSRTELPFVKSWFVLHGKEGERRLGAVESPNNGVNAITTVDAYEALHGQEGPFKDTHSLLYTAADGSNYLAPEHLTLIGRNSLFYLHPFDLIINSRGYNLMVPDGASRINLSYAVTNNSTGRYAAIITDTKKLIHGGPNGFYYNPQTLSDYQVDKIYINNMGTMAVWDNAHKQFLYYNFNENWYTWDNGPGRPSGVVNSALLTPFPENLFSEGELNNMEVVWLGTNIQTSGESGATAILRDTRNNTIWTYLITFASEGDKGDKGGDMQIVKQRHPNLVVDLQSKFSTSVGFANQIFYSKDDVVYHYNMVTQENTEVYRTKEGEVISMLKFREPESHFMVANENRTLAIVTVSADGNKGKIYEIEFSQSADVLREVEFNSNFGPIVDIGYSFIHRIIR